MRPGLHKALGVAVLAPGLLVVALCARHSAADEPRGLGRLFRFGGSASASPTAAPARPQSAVNPPGSNFGAPAPGTASAPGEEIPPPVPVTTPASPAQRIVPQSRTSRPVTEADPIVTRVALVRSNDGAQFGVFLQLFADGTVIDGEGVHRVGRAALKPVLDALQDTDLYRLRGHCGAPATDFTEYVHMVVFERNFGKLRANAFSYSGNIQGCDAGVRQLHNALDMLQTKLSRPATAAPAEPAAAPPVNSANAIPLTPN
jgi:hypothetical protein